MVRLILFGSLFILLTPKRQFCTGQLYGQSSGRVRSSNYNINEKVSRFSSIGDYIKQLSVMTCPTFMQSRRFHPDELARDIRDLGQPATFTAQISSSYYTYGGAGSNYELSSQQGCRLTDNFCSHDYQCCSGKCRCVRWTVTGMISCYKKCF